MGNVMSIKWRVERLLEYYRIGLDTAGEGEYQTFQDHQEELERGEVQATRLLLRWLKESGRELLGIKFHLIASDYASFLVGREIVDGAISSWYTDYPNPRRPK